MSDLQDVRNRILRACENAGRSDIPELVAVSKMQSLEKMMLVYEEGQKIFGENYVQELVEKKAKLDALGALEVQLHFIGHLQTNKVKLLLPHTNTIHSVGSLKLLHEIASRASQLSKKINCYFEVNIDAEESKSGFSIDALEELSLKIGDYQEVIYPRGLMCIPNPDQNTKNAFSRLRSLSHTHRRFLGSGLSMGMSDDFELAVTEGATSLRVGSAIFGKRPI